MASKNNFLEGYKWFRLTVERVSQTYGRRYRGVTLIHCICECGKRLILKQEIFVKKRSCGCVKGNSRYGEYDKRIYRIWRGMKIRCFCETVPNYDNYGGRGIAVCAGLMDFKNFQRVLGEIPSDSHSIDRENNEGNYSCGECEECKSRGWVKNVRWANRNQQARNRRGNYSVTVDGVIMTLKEACALKGLPYKQIHERVRRGGWDINIAINTPVINGTSIRYKQLVK
jgi:hypothetical protein